MPGLTIKNDVTTYIDADGNPVSGPDKGLFGTGAFAKNVTKVRKVVYDNGEVWVSVNDAPLSYVKTDPQLGTASRAEDKAAGGTVISAPSSQKTIIVKYPDDTRSEFPNPNYEAPKATFAPAGQTDPTDKYITVYDPTTGTMKPIENPNYDPAMATAKANLLQAQIAAQQAAANASGASAGVAANRLAWEIARAPQEDAVKALQAQQEREAANLRQLSGDYTSAWNKNLDFALPEGQDYWAGFEPGGVQEQLMRRYGLNYTAPKAGRVPFNPWQAAQQMGQ